MTKQESFFEELRAQLDAKLPFVVYRKPKSVQVDTLLQKNDDLIQSETTNQEGFVFSSFSGEQRILIPTAISNKLSTSFQGSTNTTRTKSFVEINDDTRNAHIEFVDKAVSSIKKGILDKVVLSRKQLISVKDLDPFEIYKNLLSTYSNAFCYLWYHPKVGMWLGASPETFVKYQDTTLTTMSLAGTKPLIDEKEIEWGAKEKDEQQLVTDYILNQLKTVCPPNTAIKTDGVRTSKAGNVGHLKTTISLELEDNKLLDTILNALHPTPAVAGLPTKDAIEFITKHENYDRSFYTGYLGEVTTNSTSLFVNLRCMQIDGEQAIIYVGGGITAGSIPEKEWEETVHKSKTMLNILTN